MIGFAIDLARFRRVAVGGAPPAPPFALTLNRTVYGYGSSTMAGNQDGSGVTMLSVLNAAAAGDAPVNRGSGGSNGIQVTAAVQGASAAEKANGDFVIQYAGVTSTTASAEAELANLQNAIGASGLNGNARWLALAKFVDNDAGNQIGNLDWTRIGKFYRLASAAYPAQVVDMQQVYRYAYTPVDANDAADQAIGRAPRSAMRTAQGDTAHSSQVGYTFLSNQIIIPWTEGVNGGIPFVPPYRKVYSTASTAQTNGGLVATIAYTARDAAGVAQGLSGVTVSGGDGDFSFVKNGDAIELRRASGSFIDEDRRFVTLTLAKGGRSHDYPAIVSIGTLDDASSQPRRPTLNGVLLAQDVVFPSITGIEKTLSFALDVEWLSSATDGVQITLLSHGLNGNTIFLQRQNSGQWRLAVSSDTGAILCAMANGGTSYRHYHAQGRVWVFGSIDTDDIANARIYLTYNDGVTAASTYNVLPGTMPSRLLLIGNATSAGGPVPSTLIGSSFRGRLGMVWMSAGKVDFSIAANRNLVRNAATGEPMDIGPTGELGGALPAPFLYLRGGAADVYAGRNFAPNSIDWICGDIATGGGNAGRILP